MAFGKNFVLGVLLLFTTVVTVNGCSPNDQLTGEVHREERSAPVAPVPSNSLFTSPIFSPEESVTNQIVLTMLGVSTYNSVMKQRNSSSGAKSENIIVIFSIPSCNETAPDCVNTGFTVTQESETNFTVIATLVSNSDLNDECKKEIKIGHAFFHEYPGYAVRLADTEPFTKYYIAFMCEEVVGDDLSFWDWVIIGAVLVLAFVIIGVLVATCIHCCKKSATPTGPPPESHEMVDRSAHIQATDQDRLLSEDTAEEGSPGVENSNVAADSSSGSSEKSESGAASPTTETGKKVTKGKKTDDKK